MNLSELLLVVRARWRVIVAVVAVGVLGGVAVAALTPKTYESFTNIYITSQGSGDDLTKAYQGGLLSQERVKSYTELISSLRLATDVRDDLRLPEPPAQIAGEISANATVDTVVITVRVDSANPQRAAAIANSAGRSFERLVAEIEAPLGRGRPPAVAARVVQRAEVATGPVSPSYPLDIALGLLAGIAVGLAAALVSHRMDRSVQGPKQAEELTGAALMGTIPLDAEIDADPLPVYYRPHSAVAESFRQVRTSLRFDRFDGGSTVLMVASSVPGEGRTTSAANLAISLASDGARVVLVEADLRRPRMAPLLGLGPSVGLSTVLNRQAPLDLALQSWGGIMSVISCGPLPPNPSELLGSSAMREVLAELRTRFDVVLLDCPPMRTVADAAVLSGLCDGALMVCRDGKTDAADLSRSAADLRRASARLVGLVVVGAWTAGASTHDGYGGTAAPAPRRLAPVPPPVARREHGVAPGPGPVLRPTVGRDDPAGATVGLDLRGTEAT